MDKRIVIFYTGNEHAVRLMDFPEQSGISPSHIIEWARNQLRHEYPDLEDGDIIAIVDPGDSLEGMYVIIDGVAIDL